MARSSATRSLDHSAPVFAALGDTTRLRVVTRLCEEGSLSITRLTEGSAISRQAMTKHLRVLGDAGIVRNARAGRENVWELAPRRLAEARRWLDTIEAEWDERVERLRSFVED